MHDIYLTIMLGNRFINNLFCPIKLHLANTFDAALSVYAIIDKFKFKE
jgi:hypothetical protein